MSLEVMNLERWIGVGHPTGTECAQDEDEKMKDLREQKKPVISLAFYGIAALFFCGCLVWAYWPTLTAMAYKWQNDPQYSQGYLVPVFSALLLYLRRDMVRKSVTGIDLRGLVLIIFGAGLHVLTAYFNLDWVDGASLIPVVGGFFLLLGGPTFLKWAWPGVFFLIFMVPLPYSVETALGYPLQRIATVGSTFLLQTAGISAISEGTVILLSQSKIGVVEACSGLSMLLIFFAIATAIVILYQPPWLDRICLLLSAIPIAVIVNILRITATGMSQEFFGVEFAEKIFHDWAGWLMMPVAFGLLALEIWVLKVLFPVQDLSRKKPLGIPSLPRSMPFPLPRG
jgi:exosortase